MTRALDESAGTSVASGPRRRRHLAWLYARKRAGGEQSHRTSRQRSAVAVGVALHCGVGRVNAWARHEPHSNARPLNDAPAGVNRGSRRPDALAASLARSTAQDKPPARGSPSSFPSMDRPGRAVISFQRRARWRPSGTALVAVRLRAPSPDGCRGLADGARPRSSFSPTPRALRLLEPSPGGAPRQPPRGHRENVLGGLPEGARLRGWALPREGATGGFRASARRVA
jgi:hypothetical protein